MAGHRVLKSLTAGLCAVVMLGACQTSETVGSEDIHPWLNQVDLETSYLIANRDPLSDAAFDRWVGSFWPVILYWLDAEFDTLDGRWENWLAKHKTSQGWRETGINPNGYWIVYEDASIPTAKLPLDDPSRFWATLTSLGLPEPMAVQGERDALTVPAQEITIPLPASLTLGEYASGHPWSLNLHTQADWLTMRLIPSVEGLSQPPSGLTGDFSEPVATWSHQSWETFLDAHTIVGPIGGLIRPSKAMDSRQLPTLACQTQWAAWDQTSPQVIFGTPVLDATTLEFLVRYQATDYPLASLETDPLISSNVASALHAEVAGIGLALDVSSVQTQMLGVLNSGRAFRDECVHSTVETWNQTVPADLTSQPIPPVASSVQGLVSRLDEWQIHVPGNEPSVRFLTEIYLSNPMFLVGLAQMLSPELAGLNLMPNQPAQKVPRRLLQPFTSAPVYLSTTPTSIRASSHDKLPEPSAMAQAHANLNTTPLWAAGVVNFQRLSELEASIQELGVLPPSDETFSSINQLAQALDLGRLSWRFGPTPDGLETWLKIEGRLEPIPHQVRQDSGK